MPIGFLYSGTLWLGNAAYLFLSVSFIQMLKVRLTSEPAPQNNRDAMQLYQLC